MAFNPHSHRSPAFALTLSWKGRPRTLKTGRVAGMAILGVLPMLAVWYLGATCYFVFHDQLLASLISRQTEIQYSYEDRIAALRSQLDRQTSHAIVDHQTLTTTMRDLASRGERLEARAAALDAVVRSFAPIPAPPRANATASLSVGNPLLAPAPLPDAASAYDGSTTSLPLGPITASPPLRLDQPGDRSPESDDGQPSDKRVELSPDQGSDQLASMYARIEEHQSDDVTRLRDPMMRSVGRLQTALSDSGLPPGRWKVAAHARGMGGPFVPLPEGSTALGFEQNLALLQDAVVERKRLTSLIDQVPLRQPLPGQLAVTSPFGARLDPFFGRAAMHTGLDLMGAYGGPVHATAAGIVTVAGSEGGYGQMVEIDHGNGLVTRYAHLSSIAVSLHQRVAVGTIVGHIGSTGRATGPHLHYETRINGEAVNPARFLKAGAGLFRS